MQNKFTEGEVVVERIRPTQKLVVKRIAANIYYCMDQNNAHRNFLVYLEHELAAADSTNAKKK